jgi:nitrite reductase/ring-hydroxylating ferredoxin subunit/uncharacterized membrane protein
LNDPRQLGERLEAIEALDRVADPLYARAAALLPPGEIKDALHGVWLGHPLHPVLTDLPIGFWTSSFVLDLVGGRRSRAASDALVGWGVVCAVPTAVAGLADWSALDRPERRAGAVHAIANVAATGLYALSFMARRRGWRLGGVALGLVGATAATVGGFLGGHLVYRRGSGANHATAAPAGSEWRRVTVDGELSTGAPALAHLDDALLAVVGRDRGPAALYDICSHLGGPLHEGEVVDGCLRCPWHGSMFRIDDGRVARGPATAPQPAYEVRVDAGRVDARRRAEA